MEILLDHDQFHASVADLHRACSDIASFRAQARDAVAHLLDGAWTGPAASAFAEGWADWLTASHVLTTELSEIAGLLTRIHGTLHVADTTTSQAVDGLAAGVR